jgi:hypothetical protein
MCLACGVVTSLAGSSLVVQMNATVRLPRITRPLPASGDDLHLPAATQLSVGMWAIWYCLLLWLLYVGDPCIC